MSSLRVEKRVITEQHEGTQNVELRESKTNMTKDQILEKIKIEPYTAYTRDGADLYERIIKTNLKINEIIDAISSLSERIEKLEGKEEKCKACMINEARNSLVEQANKELHKMHGDSYIGAGGGKLVEEGDKVDPIIRRECEKLVCIFCGGKLGKCKCHNPTPLETWGEGLEDVINDVRWNSSADSVVIHEYVRNLLKKERESIKKDLLAKTDFSQLDKDDINSYFNNK